MWFKCWLLWIRMYIMHLTLCALILRVTLGAKVNLVSLATMEYLEERWVGVAVAAFIQSFRVVLKHQVIITSFGVITVVLAVYNN